ncbi:DUF397 domain-containing protein [Streptomyces sp. 21So2-11]|uniref:DUF397 domain-containing protein n=1 Tax=Streptomyces sp. 21So2-11 TaxID=3144408 RepID=UPI00321B334C
MNTASIVAQLAAAGWFKSSYSAAENECVEMARTPQWVGVRDSKDLSGPSLIVPTTAFAAFVDGVKGDGVNHTA